MARWTRRLTLAALAGGALLLAPALAQPQPEAWQAAQVSGWQGGEAPASVLQMRAMNPEWDFMSRTFLVLTLADQALADASLADDHLAVMDAIIEDTIATEQARGSRHYLMSYADRAPFQGTGRSLFVDGEILLMINSRRMVRDDRWQAEAGVWSGRVVENFGSAGALPLAESYPDEGWMFCHTLAMVGLRMSETLDGEDHSALRDSWLAAVRDRLIDPDTGMIVSEFDMRGRHHDGPEGSSIWLTAVGMRLLDPALAEQQYGLARAALGRSVLGMGYAQEWPAGAERYMDIDSGPIVPVLDASASSSGFAIAASRAFGDDAWNQQLTRALGAAEVTMAVIPPLAAAADNPVGQSVILWGLHFGPLWDAVGTPQT